MRVICADANPAGPGLREEPVEVPFAGEHPSRAQPVHLGSYGVIDGGFDLGGDKGLTFSAVVWPTTPGLKRRHA